MPKPALTVCVYSFHPLILAELNRLITSGGAAPISHKLKVSDVADLKSLVVPNASAYVVEANARSRTTQSIVRQILVRQPMARLLVVAERLDDAVAFPLLRLGVKGLLSHAELAQHLARALAAVAAGGCWVPRAVLSRFVDATLGAMPRLRTVSTSPHLSRREREVYELLVNNLSNKEIARRLNVSERTVKFHLSNLLRKHRVKRRVDLILLSFSERQSA